MTLYMTREKIAEELLASFKLVAEEKNLDLTDTTFELSIDHTINEGEDDDVHLHFGMVGYDEIIINLLTAYLMQNKDKADRFIEAVNGLGDKEVIKALDINNQNHSFIIKLTVDKELNPTVEFNDVTTGRLGVASYILHEEYGHEAVVRSRDILVGLRDKYEEGLVLTGEREPEFADVLKQIVGLLGKELEGESE